MGNEQLDPISEQKLGVPCEDCGEAFSAFLNEMATHNAQVTACPKCGKQHALKPAKPPMTVSRPRVQRRKLAAKI
jgi:Zn finger protein HypA/HybF involved in hydrogenase expression